MDEETREIQKRIREHPATQAQSKEQQRVAGRLARWRTLEGWQGVVPVTQQELMGPIREFYGSVLSMPQHVLDQHDVDGRRLWRLAAFSHWTEQLELVRFGLADSDAVQARTPLRFELLLRRDPAAVWFRFIALNLEKHGADFDRYEMGYSPAGAALVFEDPIGNEIWVREGNPYRYVQVGKLAAD